LAGAVLTGTILRGADRRYVRNLTKEQLAVAVVDDTTILRYSGASGTNFIGRIRP